MKTDSTDMASGFHKKINEAGKYFLGTYNFSSFQYSPTDTKNPICAVELFSINQEHSLLCIRVKADRFLKQMVRTMVETLVEVGLSKCQGVDLKKIPEARDRRAARKTAPPQGLYLLKVLYE